MDRRAFLAAGAAVLPALCNGAAERGPAQRARTGIVAYSYAVRRAAEPRGPLHDPLGFLQHCRALGAGGAQLALGVRDRKYSGRLRGFLDDSGMYLEGILRLPAERAEVERFEAEVQSARACGVHVARTALLSGRRYEVFRSVEDFRRFARQSRQALALARPVVERHRLTLGVENHKDRRAGELAELIAQLRSPQVGVCLDTGNNIALLEPPQETVETLAPLAVTTHLKDMGLEEYPEGFLLAEVPLGAGFLDLPGVVAVLRRARPDIRLNLEMITRDPLRIPCLTPGYWATLEGIAGRRLAAMLSLVRARAARGGLPRLTTLPRDQRIEREEDNVRRSLRFARERLEA
jgi:sugar phosphate isomerase/epimerase